MPPRDGLQLLPCPMRLAPIESPVLSRMPGQRLSRRSFSRVAGARSLVARGRSWARASEFDGAEMLFDTEDVFVGSLTRRGRVCDPTDTVKLNRTGKSKAEMVNFLITLMPPLKDGWSKGELFRRGLEHATT